MGRRRWSNRPPTLQSSSSSAPPPASPSSSDQNNLLFDGPTPTLTPSPSPPSISIAMSDNGHDQPPHMDNTPPPDAPPIDPQFQHALYAKYYKGLAPRIKDGLVYGGRPSTLAELRSRAQALDLRYWERREEDRFKPSAAPASSKTLQTSSLREKGASYISINHVCLPTLQQRCIIPRRLNSIIPPTQPSPTAPCL